MKKVLKTCTQFLQRDIMVLRPEKQWKGGAAHEEKPLLWRIGQMPLRRSVWAGADSVMFLPFGTHFIYCRRHHCGAWTRSDPAMNIFRRDRYEGCCR
ncbi:hypothetical protein [Yeguia hominis]|uniref:Uncharacterized protein n=1 Tax=Yeguia hominis TaxID=2763662 RepID=A0A926D6C1_9FIRM|nr:hypothetical protein [Yeguia hominis]MBC8532471.1 hypothetical protein [Yeguia hominis]